MAKDFTQAAGGDTGAHPVDPDKTLLSRVDDINLSFKEDEVKQQAKDAHMSYVNLHDTPVNPDVFRLVTLEEAKAASTVPFLLSGKKLYLATITPGTEGLKSLLARLQSKGLEVQVALCSKESLDHGFSLYAQHEDVQKPTVLAVEEGDVGTMEKEVAKLASQDKEASDKSEVEVMNNILGGAVRLRASDIHIQPEEEHVQVRYRIDGMLHDVLQITPDAYDKVLTRLKFQTRMKLNVGYKPQDGKFSFQVPDRTVDVRLSTLPTEYGESVVMRLLDSKKKSVSLSELGFSSHNEELLREAMARSEGMILVTGPTGSGKTTTLYSVLGELNTKDRKIITLEDPIEYHLSGISQSQIRDEEGYTFALGLRAILRQDPNVVMLGEIRDKETADIAVQAALTGHLMLSTVHTNSSIETVPRLLNMGVMRYLLAPALILIIAQRLIRKVCLHCSTSRPMNAEEKAYVEDVFAPILAAGGHMPELPSEVKEAVGCDKCNNTGYLGQLATSEVLPVTRGLRDLIVADSPRIELEKQALSDGFIPMRVDSLIKALGGLTTIAETQGIGE